MQITKQPSAYNFAGNIDDIQVSTALAAAFTLSLNGTKLVGEEYHPVGGGIRIKLRDLLTRHTPHAILEAGSIDLPKYTFSIKNAEGVVTGSFFCIRGGHGAAADAATFMRSNWLTWQPQSRTTSYHAPQRLVYAAINACSVWVEAYFADKTSLRLEYLKITGDRLHTIDVSFGSIRRLFDAQPTSYDVWMLDGVGVRSYVQRYYLAEQDDQSDVFMWHNSIGGIDTVSFKGGRIERNSSESASALFGDIECEFDIEARKSYLKYTGYIATDNERLWVLDFFNTTSRYHIDQGAIRRVVVSKPKLEHTRGELAGYEFEFAHSDQTIYLNLPRVDTPELLEIVDPAAELFFLAPRLNQFQEARIGQGDILIPCQLAAAGKWLFVTVAEIIANATGADGVCDYNKIHNRPSIAGVVLTGDRTLEDLGLWNFGLATQSWVNTRIPTEGAHPLGGRDDFDFKARELRGATLSLLKSGTEYVSFKFEPLIGTGAEAPTPGGGGTFDYNVLTNRPLLGGVVLAGDRTLADYGLWSFGLATQSWVNTRFASLPAWAMQPTKPSYLFTEILAKPTTLAGYGITDLLHPLGGRDDLDFKARELRGATLSLLKSGTEYVSFKFEPLIGTGAEAPTPGGGGTFDYNVLTNRPLLGGVELTGDRTLADYGLWNFGLATQSWVNTRFASLPAWAMQPTKPSYLFAEILAKPTTLAGYGINDGLRLVRAIDAVNGNNLDWNTVVFDQDALSISQIAPENYIGQTNHPFNAYGQLLTFGALGSLFSSQIAISNQGIMSFRGEFEKDTFATSWKRVVTDGDSRLSNARPASDVSAWAKAASKPSYLFAEILAKPTTLAGYGINDGLRLVRAIDAVNGHDLDWNTVVFDQDALSISQIAPENYIGQTNHPFNAYGQLLTFGALGSSFSSQIAISNQGIMSFRGDHNKDTFTGNWMRVVTTGDLASASVNYARTAGNADTVAGYTAAQLWRTDNANLPSVDWACKKLTVAKFNTAGVAVGTVTLTAETF